MPSVQLLTLPVLSVENPAVNPIVAKGRSTADVQDDLHQHRGRKRKEAIGNGTLYPVYQTDYVMLQ
eukprot:3115378-Pleurochrysis_carterae.AAC.1